MRIKLWGVRGSIAAPIQNQEYRNKVRNILRHALKAGLRSEEEIEPFLKSLPLDLRSTFGGNTTCVAVSEDSLSSDESVPIILDCGTGIRPLGDSLMAGPCGRGECQIHILITHTHWDHIQGLPFFKPLYIPGNTLHFYSPYPDLQHRLEEQFARRYFPVRLDQVGSIQHFHLLEKGDPPIQLNGFEIDFKLLKHPGGSYAYRFQKGGRSFIFSTDAEFTGADLEGSDNYLDFFRESDLVLIDSQYTLDESFTRFDWGHTSYTMAVNCAIRWKVKNLVLTHHEPSYTDSHLLENLKESILHKRRMHETRPRIFLGVEGLTFLIRNGNP